jgi:hypothetical protein
VVGTITYFKLVPVVPDQDTKSYFYIALPFTFVDIPIMPSVELRKPKTGIVLKDAFSLPFVLLPVSSIRVARNPLVKLQRETSH